MFHVMPGMFGGIGGNRNGPFPGPSFFLPLGDAGAGAVNTVPIMAAGGLTATFTRATVAWTKLASGLWAQVNSGVARSCYLGQDTAVGAYGGYLSELAGIQLVTPTASIRDMTDASWVKVTTTAAKTATGIDGVANSASTLTATGATSTILQTLAAAATSRTYSAFVKRRTGTGNVFIQQGATQVDITALINSATYTRVSVTASVLNSAFGFQINTNGDAIDVDFNQFEAGAVATSPMASAGSARNIDVLTYPYAGNADVAQGSCYAEASSIYSVTFGASGAIVSIGAGGLPLFFSNGAGITTTQINDTANTATKNGLTSVSGTVRSRSSSWGAAGLAVTGDGATVGTGTFDGSMGTNTQIGIGQNNVTQALNGTVKNVRIWTMQLTNAQLQALTA